MDDEDVEDGQGDDGAHAEEGLADPEVTLEHVVLGHQEILIRFPDAVSGLSGGCKWRLVPRAGELHFILEAERNVKYYPKEEWQRDGDPGILERVQALEVGGLVNWDISVHLQQPSIFRREIDNSQ